MPFTSETAKAARAILAAKQAERPFNRQAWAREWQRKERLRRKAAGVCQHCGENIVEKFATCLPCRQEASKQWVRKQLSLVNAVRDTQRASA
jgi:hypothetical protein